MDTQVLQKKEAFTLKGSLFTFTILQLQTNKLEELTVQLADKVRQTPNFFRNSPIVLDLQKLPNTMNTVDFARLVTELRAINIFPVAVSNADAAQQQAATQAGLALIAQPTPPKTTSKTPGSQSATPRAKLITQPVRSGQQVYAKGTDLIIVSSVSPGAELLADGNIHIYGTLRGRALAGVNGDENARIFCHKLDAELVSVAGYYKLSEDIDVAPNKENLQVYLNDQQLCIDSI